MYVCICNAVTESDIRDAVDNGVRNMKQLSQSTRCATTCGSCKELAVETLQNELANKRANLIDLPIMQLA